MIRKMRILSNSAKFSAGQPLLPAHNFLATWPLPTALIVWGMSSLKFWAIENMHQTNYGTVMYCRLNNARRAALVADLPDNCHPSSFFLFSVLFRYFTLRQHNTAMHSVLLI